MKSYEEQKATIKEIGPDPEAYKRKEVKELPNILQEDEQIFGAVSGFPEFDDDEQNGQFLLVATDRRVLFIDKGIFFGLTIKDIPYEKISSIQYEKGMIFGTIKIVTSNTHIKVTKIFKSAIVPFHGIVQKGMDGILKSESQNGSPPEHIDFVAQLERLTKLKESGALTAEEFNAAKKRLLNG